MNLILLDKYHYVNESVLSQTPTVVHVGIYTLDALQKMRQIRPKARLVAVEACTSNYEKAQRDNSAFKLRASVHHLALSERNGPVTLHLFKNWVSHSLYPRHEFDKNCIKRGEEQVEGVTIQTMLKRVSVSNVDLLILNCEGAETYALWDISTLTSLRSRIQQICASFHCPRIYPVEKRKTIVSRMERYYHVIVKPHPTGIPDHLFIRRES